jgi:hypothetical protein
MIPSGSRFISLNSISRKSSEQDLRTSIARVRISVGNCENSNVGLETKLGHDVRAWSGLGGDSSGTLDSLFELSGRMFSSR